MKKGIPQLQMSVLNEQIAIGIFMIIVGVLISVITIPQTQKEERKGYCYKQWMDLLLEYDCHCKEFRFSTFGESSLPTSVLPHYLEVRKIIKDEEDRILIAEKN